MYRAYGLLHPNSDLTLAELAVRLTARFPDYTVEPHKKRVTIGSADWDMKLKLNGDPIVVSESVGLAERLAGLEDGAEVEACDRRIEVSSDTPDPQLEHFGDFQAVIGVLKTFRGVIVVDPQEPALL